MNNRIFIMLLKPMEPFGLALEEFYRGNKQAKVIFHRDDGLKEDHYVSNFFRTKNGFSPLEKHAISLCYGKVLDIGAGVGPHSLELQNLGIYVLAIDVSSHACEIMKKRGVLKVMRSNIYDLKDVAFDTVLLMGRSIGFVENLSGLKKFLTYCRDLLNPGGIILLDSIDVRQTTNQIHLAYQKRNLKIGHYFGEIRLQIEYEGQLGEKFQILHVDPQTLMTSAEELGWSCDILLKEKNGNYLAKVY
ncbi:MAG: class I SAM-dependent methyltransferase [Promethearchaeota archaeon]|jgi:2-polyprenyl-3-methyl-5-hydroxy-6-metoxy-1,4-benzoquinol methylase